MLRFSIIYVTLPKTENLLNFFKCDQCGRNFKSYQGLKIHVGKAHKSDDEPANLRYDKNNKSLELSLLTDN